MSIFNELLPKICEISNACIKNFDDDLKAVFECFDKFEEEFQNGRGKAREKAQKDKTPMTTLQSIVEDADESSKNTDTNSTKTQSSDGSATITSTRSSAESNTDKLRRASKKRTKHEVDSMSSPEQDKRRKRNASVKAQGIISKQVNVNLSQKLRRENPEKKSSTASQHRKEDDKENSRPLLNITIKQEKVSLPPEPMATDVPLNVKVKQEQTMASIEMPPPAAPVPKSRAKAAPKEKPSEDGSEEESSSRRRTTRTRKQTDTAPAPVPTPRSTRNTKQTETEEPAPPPPEARPKRTRAKRKVSEVLSEPEKEAVQTPVESGSTSPANKSRPKRTRRAQKAAEKVEQETASLAAEPIILPKNERVTEVGSSPILSQIKGKKKRADKGKKNLISETIQPSIDDIDPLDKSRVLGNTNDIDKTVVLQNGVDTSSPVIVSKHIGIMNETVVIEAATRGTFVLDKLQNSNMDCTVVLDKSTRRTFVLDKLQNCNMDCTVVLDKCPIQKPENVTEDNSLLTDDSDSQLLQTPPKQGPPKPQVTSAVKEKVQQFEEMASRVTRTKTRAMAKQAEETETHTPPDKIVKPLLSAETLTKMNSMIFNGKQISSSASKPRPHIPTAKPAPLSASKLSAINKAREEAEAKKEKEDARKKKEALLDAKRELHKKKREEKMAAAAAAREAAERERLAAVEATVRERMERQAHADQGKLERLREAERKKLELARKVAGTEERRRAEEQARQQRLAEEQRKADEARKKQLEEAAAMKKEAAIMAKEIEKRQKEYIEKQKLKRMEEKNPTPSKTPRAGNWYGSALEPAYMADGFQFLTSDDDEEEAPERPIPEWSTHKARRLQLAIQTQLSSAHVDKFFSVRVHSPDLRDIFPNIDRAHLKRTSSAVWRTPPSRLAAVTE